MTVGKVNLINLGSNGEIKDDLPSLEFTTQYLNEIKQDDQKLNNLISYIRRKIENIITYANFNWNDDKNIEIIVDLKMLEKDDPELSKWALLRRICETIRDRVGGIEELKAKKWVKDSQLLDDFYFTGSNQYLHPACKYQKV